MTPKDFEHLLDTCGAALGRWPPGARVGAERLLASSQAAREVLHAQQQVDLWLVRNCPAQTPPDFAGRATAKRQLSPISPPQRGLRTGGLVAASAAAALVAVGLGTATGLAHGHSDDPTQVLTAALAWSGETPDAG